MNDTKRAEKYCNMMAEMLSSIQIELIKIECANESIENVMQNHDLALSERITNAHQFKRDVEESEYLIKRYNKRYCNIKSCLDNFSFDLTKTTK